MIFYTKTLHHLMKMTNHVRDRDRNQVCCIARSPLGAERAAAPCLAQQLGAGRLQAWVDLQGSERRRAMQHGWTCSPALQPAGACTRHAGAEALLALYVVCLTVSSLTASSWTDHHLLLCTPASCCPDGCPTPHDEIRGGHAEAIAALHASFP